MTTFSRWRDRLGLDPLSLLSIVAITAGSMAYMLLFGVWTFRDFSIIFDGGLRVWHGQVPYRDFFTTVGPMVFYLQGFFNALTGPSALAMRVHVGVINAIVLSLFFVYARRRIDAGVALFLTAIMHFSYYGGTVNPWYNHTAIFFYWISQLILWSGLDHPEPFQRHRLFLAGAVASLSVFSKQDIGVLGVLFMLSQVVLFSRRRLTETASFLAGLLVFGGLFLAFLAYRTDFGYWFNYGQPPHSSRVQRLSGLIDKGGFKYDARWGFLLVPPLLFFLLRDYSRATVLLIYKIVGLGGMSLIIGQTSGQRVWTAYFAVPFMAVFVIQLYTENRRLQLNRQARHAVAYLVAWVVLIYALRYAPLHPVKTYFSGEFVPVAAGAYAGMRFTPAIVEGIEKVKAELRNHQSPDNTTWFLNLSEYAFLYADFGVEPPRGTHLQLQSGITSFNKDYVAFVERLKSREFEYILLQEMATGSPPEDFKDYLESLRYRMVLRVPTPKSATPPKAGPGPRYDLFVFKRLPAVSPKRSRR